MTAPFELGLGARVLGDDTTAFRVWAPRARSVALEIEGERSEMRADDGGDFVIETRAPAGTDYRYVLDGDLRRPDPASRFQPHGVHGASRVVAPGFDWTDAAWRGLPLESLVLYELHVGTFTRAGTFEAVIERLDHLRDVGINAIEVMPVAEFPGGRNWGYDGVHLYAPQSTYGGPEGLKRLVDACHRRGLAVVLDVVYNHLGPEGNTLRDFGPYFSSRHETPWGEAIAFDGEDAPGVRRHFVDNALYWLTEFHVDGLRLDAVHGIHDTSVRHVLAELSDRFHAEARRLDRKAWLIAESDLNDVRVIDPTDRGGWGMDAQWSDDFHHSLHALLTGNRRGYFVDFGRAAHLATALGEGFVLSGQPSRFRGRPHGTSASDRPGRQLVVYSQNHDQIANACRGSRHTALLSGAEQRLAATLVLLAPNVPMLFQGQEHGATAPFHYFTSHADPALVDAVRKGRAREVEAFGDGSVFLDPQAQETFEACKLDWDQAGAPPHARAIELHRDLIALRRATPELRGCRKDLVVATADDGSRTLVVSIGNLTLAANFSDQERSLDLPTGRSGRRRVFSTEDPRYGGAGTLAPEALGGDGAAAPVRLAPHSAVVYRKSDA